MIVIEFYRKREDGVKLYRTYSDKGMYIIQDQTGIEYSEAIDVEGSMYTYTETDKPIEVEPIEDEATEEDYIAALAELGVTDEENNA